MASRPGYVRIYGTGAWGRSKCPGAGGDVDEQISQIEYFIQKEMDVIVIIPINGEALYDVVKEAKDKGIKVVCYDRMIANVDADLYITIDNEMVGT